MRYLAVTFGAIMSFAKHLAVGDVRFAALGPGRDMVGIHLEKLPDAGAVGVVADGAIGAIGDAVSRMCMATASGFTGLRSSRSSRQL